jgi:hypothetical protein
MGEFAYDIFGELKLQQYAAPSWNKLSGIAKRYTIGELRVKYLEFELCDDDWKATYFASAKYNNWTKTHLRGTNGDRIKVEKGLG